MSSECHYDLAYATERFAYWIALINTTVADEGERMSGSVDAHIAVGQEPLIDYVHPEPVLRLMDSVGTAVGVLGPTGRWAAVDNTDGNSEIARWIRRWPDRFRGYATVNPWYGNRALAELRRAHEDGLGGVKIHPSPQGVSLVSPLLDDICEYAAQASMPIYVVTGTPLIAEPLQLVELARRHLGATFIMGRSGRTDFKTELVVSLLLSPNIVAESAHNDPRELREVLAAIGPERLVFASDSPYTNMAQERRKVDDLNLSPDAYQLVSGANIASLFANAVGATA
jgi:predicted TIM-barrel fold metal-dependent hydrolase